MAFRQTYIERAATVKNEAAKKLLKLMDEKKTNLALANDETDPEKFIALAEQTGPELAVLKTHIDVIENFSSSIAKRLRDLAAKHHFMIFEDRKFADIGNTVSLQYQKGIYKIVEWADFVNAHIVPGPGIIEGLQKVGAQYPEPRGLILLAQMSSKGNLATGAYTKKAVEMAKSYPEFVVGFIGNGGDVGELRRLSELTGPELILFTPGVKLGGGADTLKQQYTTPADVIEAGSDVIIVGRGVYGAKDPLAAAKEYRQVGWEAYKKMIAER